LRTGIDGPFIEIDALPMKFTWWFSSSLFGCLPGNFETLQQVGGSWAKSIF
jgi:hypothetical protein